LFDHDIDYKDTWAEENNTFETATPITLPFSSADIAQYTEIEPTGADVDFFQFQAAAGDIIKVEVTRGQFDSVAGIFAPDGTLVALDDDSGLGSLSKVQFQAPTGGMYAVAVSAFADVDFTGDGGSGGRYVLIVSTFNLGVPSPDNWLTNASFETGDFLGWNVIETATPFIPLTVSDGSIGTYFTQAVPQDGSYLAVGGFDGEGPMQILLYQDVSIPVGEPFLTLEWKERLQYALFAGPTLSRTYAVLILDPATNGLLRIVTLLDTGILPDYTDTGWVDQSFDVSEFIGQTIRLMYYQDIPEPFTGPGQFELDDVRLRSQ
ncbi:MAG: PPC domain-containing protein, partial [Verrucomicrobiales bacterium]